MNNFQQENNELIKNFLERTFFRSWANPKPEIINKEDNYFFGNYGSLEFNTTPSCSNNCKYCYSVKNAKEYYPDKTLWQTKNIFKNAKMVLNWLEEKKYQVRLEIFGGDSLAQNVGYMILNEVLAKSANGHPVAKEIVIPTNMNFLFNDKRTEEVEEFIKLGRKFGTPVYLSASIDGAYLEENRPLTINKIRDVSFYDKLFKFAKKHGTGFHPMVYSNGIEKWIDNFQWFQEKFKEYSLPPNNIYLLEVRNAEWTEKQCIELYKFMHWLAIWVSDIIKTKQDPIKELFKNHWNFNILSSPFNQIGRGLGCSIQSGLYLRLGDLSFFPCHRLLQDFFKLFRFVTEKNKITDIEAYNPELFIAINSLNAVNFPMCEQCPLKNMCSHQCLGSSFESVGDIFIPDPNVCRMEHFKVLGILQGFKEGGMLDMILNAITPQRKEDVLYFMNLKEKK